MPVNYCLPLVASNCDDCLSVIQQNETEYEYFELWLDYLKDPRAALKIAQNYPNKIIYLFRRLKLEPPLMSIKERQQLILELSKQECFIDFDYFSQKEDLDFYLALSENQSKLLLSYHNYQLTPDELELTAIANKLAVVGPAILKIACFCNSPDDALRLLNLQQNLLAKNFQVIILGMGTAGLATRIFGTLWGNAMIFAPIEKVNSTAVNQLNQSELKSIFKILNAPSAD